MSGTGAGTFTNLNVTGTGGTLAGTYAPSFTNVSLAGGSSLTSTANPLNFSTLNVQGLNASYTGTLNAAGKNLNFDLAGAAAGNSLLTTSSAENIAGATLGLTNIPTTLNLGQSVTLISQSSGTAATTSASASSGAVNYTYSLGGTNTLRAFLGTIQTAGDYTLTGPYSATAGAAAGENVLLDVGGALTVTGGGLSLTDNGAQSARVNAATLMTPSLSLTGANTGATIGTLDVTTGNTALSLDGTTAAGVNIGDVTFANGNALNVTQANGGTMTFGGNLFVAGSGNTLNSPIAYNAVGKTLTFDLPASLTPGQTILNVTGDADITGSTVALTYQTVRPIVQPGESLTLLAATSLTANQTGLTVQTASGDIYTLLVSNNQLLAMLQQISPTTPAFARLKAFAEGRTATLSFVNQGQDLILNQGFGSALAATAGAGYQLAGFGGFSGGWSRYNTGSHVDVNGASLLTGIAVGNDLGAGRLTAGLFFEGGWGNYNSQNSFSNFASVKGDGDTSYLGGGVLGRYDVTTGALSGLYFDASARMGRAKMDFYTDDIKYNGNDADFDSSSMYYGAHAGLGYQWGFSEKAMLDLSGKFLWTRQQGDNVDVHGDKVRFKDADSLRTRLGGRFNYAVNEFITPYAGAYWEHEFDGKARSSVNGVGIDAPTLKGDTGVGELGLTVKPVANSGFSFDLGVQGYTGVREGVTGSVQLKFEF